jgi:hypothetical protein
VCGRRDPCPERNQPAAFAERHGEQRTRLVKPAALAERHGEQ